MLVDPRTLSRITDALDLGGEVRSEYPREVRAEPASGPMYLKCPRCAGLMSRRLFAPGAKVVVDQCAAHGTWFDASELRAVADFAAGGGLERAASEEAASRRARQAAAGSGARLSGELPLPASDGHDDAWPGLLSELFTWFRRDDD